MGTTLTAVYVEDGQLAIAHVGDSRAYLFRDGELGLLTQDHTLVGELVKRGKLTEEQAAEHPQRSIITRALGIDAEVEVDTWTYGARAGDVVLLCSDGLTSMISEEQIVAVLVERARPRRRGRPPDRRGQRGRRARQHHRDPVHARGGRRRRRRRRADRGRDGAGHRPGPRTAPPEPHRPERAAPATITASRRRAPAHDHRPGGAPGAARSARTQGRRRTRGSRRAAGSGRFVKPLAALLATVIVLFLVGGGGYLATRQLFFVGTNNQGIVTIFRGLPYDLPFGIRLYETFYVSGVPAQFVPRPAARELINHQIRSQAMRSASSTRPSWGSCAR